MGGTALHDARPPCPRLSQTVKTDGLPAAKLLWLNDSALVTVGHNMNPDLFVRDAAAGGRWGFYAPVDAATQPGSKAELSSFGTARALFNAKVTKGVHTTGGAAAAAAAPGGGSSTEPWTKHVGCITSVQPFASTGEGN